jgi:hypothetical protein
MKKFLFVMLSLSFMACSSVEDDQSDRAIKSTFDVVDIRLSSSAPDQVYNKNSTTAVGFGDDGSENRMLVYFPKVDELYDDDVIVSSITNMELLIHCLDVPAHPDSIKIYPLSKPWTAYSTWNSYFAILPNNEWGTPGGDYDDTAVISSPAIRTNTDDSSYFELAFNITDFVKSTISEQKPNYGFIILVEKNDLNSEDQMTFYTSNSSKGAARPSAILAFSTQDLVVD